MKKTPALNFKSDILRNKSPVTIAIHLIQKVNLTIFVIHEKLVSEDYTGNCLRYYAA